MSAAAPPRVGVLGLGAMGGAVAANLLSRGFAVTGYDVRTAALDELVVHGGVAVDSPAQLARSADVVIVSLPSSAAFQDAVLGAAGLCAGARANLVVIETSTLPISLKRQALGDLSRRKAQMLDCPISGTGHQARTGDLVILASGDRDTVESCVPVFRGFGRAHHYLGAFGAGSEAKFVANLLVAIHNAAAAEALSLIEAAGLDAHQLLDALADGAGTSRMLEVRGPRMIARDYADGVRLTIFEKDLDLIAEFAAEQRAPTPVFALCAQLHRAASACGFAKQDSAAVFEVFRQLGGR